MGDDWDDDEWDDDAIEEKLAAQQKEKENARRREEGLDDEDEDEDDDGPPSASAASPASAKATSKPKAKPKVKSKAESPQEEPALTAQEQKLRQRKLQEAQNDATVGDLFAGFQVKDAEEEKRKTKKAEEEKKTGKPKIVEIDAFDQVSLKVQADVEKLGEACATKIGKGAAAAKGGTVSFLRDLLKQLADDFSFKELDGFEKMIADVVKEKKAAKGASTDGKANKANTKLSKTTKFDTANEWEEVYGGGAGDEDWTQEEWDEWEKQEAAKWEQWSKSQTK